MLLKLKNKRDLLGGVVISLFGLVGIFEGRRIGVGTARSMGPGYVPLALGAILILLGLFMALRQGVACP